MTAISSLFAYILYVYLGAYRMFRSALRNVVLPRAAPSARASVRALHASPMLRDEEVRVYALKFTCLGCLNGRREFRRCILALKCFAMLTTFTIFA